MKPPAVYTAGLLRRIGAADRHDVVGVDRLRWRGSSSSIRRTSPAGTTRAGSTPRPGAGAGGSAQNVLRPYALDPGKAAQPYDAAALVDERARVLAPPAARPSTTHAALLAFAQGRARAMPANASWKRKQYAGDDAERAAPADRRQPGAADGMSDCNHCDGPLALAAPAQRRGRSGPRAAGDRAGHAAAGGHGPLAPVVRRAEPRRDARRLRRLAARASARSRTGSRAAATRPGAARARQHLPRGRRGRAVGALAAGRPALPQASPEARARAAARRSPRTTACTGIPRPAGSHSSTASRRSTVMPADRLHERRPEPLHVPPLLGGRRDERRTSAPAGSAATSTASGRWTTRCRGSRSTTRSRPRSRPRRCRSRRSTGPTSTTSGATASGARSSSGCSPRSARSARRAERPRARQPRRASAAQVDRLRNQLLPFQGDNGITSPVHVPEVERRVPEAARRARRDARRRPADARRRR